MLSPGCFETRPTRNPRSLAKLVSDPFVLFRFADIGTFSRSEPFSSKLHDRYRLFYERGLQDILTILSSSGASGIRVFYPSTILLNDGEPRWREFTAAKGEAKKQSADFWMIVVAAPFTPSIALASHRSNDEFAVKGRFKSRGGFVVRNSAGHCLPRVILGNVLDRTLFPRRNTRPVPALTPHPPSHMKRK